MTPEETGQVRALVEQAVTDALDLLYSTPECEHSYPHGCLQCQAEVATEAVMPVFQEVLAEAWRRIHVSRFDAREEAFSGPDSFYHGVLHSQFVLDDLIKEVRNSSDSDHREPYNPAAGATSGWAPDHHRAPD